MIYVINCACGDTYISETGRTLEIRMKEHKRACIKADFEKSAVAEVVDIERLEDVFTGC